MIKPIEQLIKHPVESADNPLTVRQWTGKDVKPPVVKPPVVKRQPVRNVTFGKREAK